MNNESLFLNVVKTIFALVLLYVGYLTATGAEPYYLYNADLAFHEGGHTIFFFFGEFIQFLGGTLMQILLPLFFAVYFFFNRAEYSASVSSWWLGVNLYEIGTYAADAEAQALPLLSGEHDWAYILGKLGLVSQCGIIGGVFHILGISIIFISALFALASISNISEILKRIANSKKN